MKIHHLWLAILWAAYCVVHSALISISATNFFMKALGKGYRFYRLAFNIFSIAGLAALVVYSRSPRFQGDPVFAWTGPWRILMYCLIALAFALVIAGARHYSMSQFLGIRQVLENKVSGGMADSGDFEKTGVLGLVRHPWYVAVFILLWASDTNAAGIVINLVLSAYLVIGTLLEERKLVLEFGDRYKRYQEEVSMFIPIKWLGTLLRNG